MSVAYLRGFYNPDADEATVTITKVNPMTSIVGTFEAKYRNDMLRGTFDAAYCATGVEP